MSKHSHSFDSFLWCTLSYHAHLIVQISNILLKRYQSMSDMQSVNLTNQSVHQNRSKPGSNSSTPSIVSSVFRHHKGRRFLSHPSVFYPAVACRQKKQMMKDNYFTLASAPVLPVGWYTRYTLLGVAMANKQHNTTTKKTVVYATTPNTAYLIECFNPPRSGKGRAYHQQPN